MYEMEHLKQTHDTLDTVNCFNSIGVEYRSIFPVKIKTRPCIMLLKRKPGIEIPEIDAMAGQIIDLDEQIRLGAENLKLDGYLVTETEPETGTVELNDAAAIDEAEEDDDEQLADNGDDASSFVETELKAPNVETQRKLQRLIVRRYRMRKASDNTEVAVKRGTAKANIKHIIRSEKIKELIETISQMDLKSLCDLDTETTKSCLLKVIDSYDFD